MVAEGPIFISPAVVLMRERKCVECGIESKPLVYQAGYVIEPQHFHEHTEGGIYFYRKSDRQYKRVTVIDSHTSTLVVDSYGRDLRITGWIAIVEPRGQIKPDSGNINAQRAEQIRVQQINAYCFRSGYHHKDESKLISHDFLYEATTQELQEGVVIERRDYDRHSSELLPICGLKMHPEYSSQVRYSFRKSETGEILFSEVGIRMKYD